MVFGTPVYAGRVPNKIMPYVRDSIAGDGSVCVAMVAFGCRAFDDALAELCQIAEDNGFQVIAAAATATEHSFAAELGKGRPDERDLQQIRQFAEKAAHKIILHDTRPPSVPGERHPEKYYTPLRMDGQPAHFLKSVPMVDRKKCTGCGKCAQVCPMGSIGEDPSVHQGICIKCQACIHFCPTGARSFQDSDFCSHRQMLQSQFGKCADSVFCL